MRIKSFTAEPEDIAPLRAARRRPRSSASSCALVGAAKGVLIARLAGIEDRNQAEALRGLRLYLPRSALPPTEAEEYYHADLIGLEAVLADGTPARAGARGARFRRRRHARDRARRAPPVLVPFTRAVVPVVDLDGGPAGARAAARAARPDQSQGKDVGMSWRATVLTIFPEMLPGPLGYSLAGKALQAGLWRLETVDIRDFARDKHRSVDDAPFGGGPGMVMRPDVLDAAIAGSDGAGPLILLSPRGRSSRSEAGARSRGRSRG